MRVNDVCLYVLVCTYIALYIISINIIALYSIITLTDLYTQKPSLLPGDYSFNQKASSPRQTTTAFCVYSQVALLHLSEVGNLRVKHLSLGVPEK